MEKQVKELLELKLDKNIILEKPKDKKFGHFASPIAFSLAKEYKKSPIIIANELAKEFEDLDLFEKVEPIKGFLNFKLSFQFLDKFTTYALKNEKDFGREVTDKTILLEYVSANPTGPLHIGHARGAVLGDALNKIGNHLGYKLDTEYYVNDAGKQMNLLGLSIFLAGKEHILKEEVNYPEQYYRGEYILDLIKLAEEKFTKNIFYDDINITTLANFGKDEVLNIIKKDLKDMGIIFDNFISEKSLYNEWDLISKKLFDNGALYIKDEKTWLKTTKYNDEKDRVVVREDGIPTYLAGDIIYHNDKFKRGYDKYINI